MTTRTGLIRIQVSWDSKKMGKLPGCNMGCQSHMCLLEKPKGQGVNGPCTCLDSLDNKTKKDVKNRLRRLEFYRMRINELEKNKDKFPEPYYSMICNILANGRINP